MTISPTRALCALAFLCACALSRAGELGVFTAQSDVGSVSRPGSALYDAARGTYTVGSSGANMWFAEDDMHFVWKKASGDLSIAASIAFVGTSQQPHRKGVLMIRQTLDPGSPMVDVSVHGDGLTSLQFRDAQGGATREIQSMVAKPGRVRLDKIGDDVFLSVAAAGEQPHPSGARSACISPSRSTSASRSPRTTTRRLRPRSSRRSRSGRPRPRPRSRSRA